MLTKLGIKIEQSYIGSGWKQEWVDYDGEFKETYLIGQGNYVKQKYRIKRLANMK